MGKLLRQEAILYYVCKLVKWTKNFYLAFRAVWIPLLGSSNRS